MNKKIFFLLFLILLLASCATKPQATNSGTNLMYHPAINIAPNTNTNFPLKKQTIPTKALVRVKNLPVKPKQIGIRAVARANKKALHRPNSRNYIGSVMTFDYQPEALYKIYCAPLSVTDLELQAGEHIYAIAAGDTLRWQIEKTYSGKGALQHEHLLLKPSASGLTNTLVVTTDQRTYHLLLTAAQKTYMPMVKWRYAQDEKLLSMNNFSARQENLTKPTSDLGTDFDINHLDFHYQIKLIKGPKPEWLPNLVFNDSNKTYIRLPHKIQEAPTLFIGNKKSTKQIINYRVVGDYYVVDSLFPEAELRAGQGRPIIVRISYRRTEDE